MKFKNILKKTTLLIIVILLNICAIFSVFSVDETIGEDIVTEPVTVATEVVTEQVTQAPTEQVTDAPTEEPTEEPTEKPTEKATENVATEETTLTTYGTTESLPQATTMETVTAVTVPKSEAEESGDLTYGLVSWACVIVGVLVITVILISNKTKGRGARGKHRYDEGDKITGQKRLLNDDYYNNRKYNSYYNKDTRK